VREKARGALNIDEFIKNFRRSDLAKVDEADKVRCRKIAHENGR